MSEGGTEGGEGQGRHAARPWGRRLAGLAGAHALWTPLLAWAVTRAGIVLVAYLAGGLMVDNPLSPPYHLFGVENRLLDIFASRWDTGFYLSIAEEGYRDGGPGFPSVPFFPLLPLQMRALAPLVGSVALAGLLITNLALLGAALLLYQLVRLEADHDTSSRAVWYLLLFPTSFFGSAIYSESLFLLGAIGALYLARRGLWESAGLAGLLTALSRLTGLLVAPMLLVEWWQQRRATGSSSPRWALIAPLMVPLGTLGYALYLQLAFGDPLAFMTGSAAWGREPRSPIAMIVPLLERPPGGWGAAVAAGALPLDNWLDLSLSLLALAGGALLLRQRRWSEATFVLLGAGVALGSGLLMSQRRYVWVLFPLFILLARWGRRPWVDRAVTVLFSLGLALFVALFATGYWVG